jgi:hypothetical protein
MGNICYLRDASGKPEHFAMASRIALNSHVEDG